MGEVKHISTFLRTSLVKDPYCLGDFLEAKDVLRIENEYPEFFKSGGGAKARSPCYKNPSLQYSKPASGSPYKIPVIPKSCLRATKLCSTTQKPQVKSKTNIQRAHSDVGSQQSYPHITICTKKHPLPSTLPFKNILEEKSGISLGQKNVGTNSVLTQTKSIHVQHSGTKSEPRKDSCVTRRPSSSAFHVPTKARIPEKVKTEPLIAVHSASPRVSFAHVGSLRTLCPQPSTPSLTNWTAKHGSAICMVSGVRQMDPQVQPSATFKKAPGFIRPTFSKKTNKRNSRRSLLEQISETGEDSGSTNLLDTNQHAKYEEILEEEAEMEHTKGGGSHPEVTRCSPAAGSLLSTRPIPGQHSSDDNPEAPCKNPCISRSEQALLAELLAVEYRESGKFGKKPISSKSSISVGSTGLKPSEIAGNEPSSPSFRITYKQKMILEKLAKVLIQEEMRTCLNRKEGNVRLDAFTATQDKETSPPTSKNEMVLFYKEGIKEMTAVGVTTDVGSVQDDSLDKEFLPSSSALTTSEEVNAETEGVLPIYGAQNTGPIANNNVPGYELHIHLSDKLAPSPSTSSSPSGSPLEEELVENLDSNSPEDYPPTFDEETSQGNDDNLKEECTEVDTAANEDSSFVPVKDFPILSTILEEAFPAGTSVATPPFIVPSPADELKEPAVTANNETESHDVLQKSNPDKNGSESNNDKKSLPNSAPEIDIEIANASFPVPNAAKLDTGAGNEKKSTALPSKQNGEENIATNNDVTDCSSISDYILSEPKSPPRPMTTLTNAQPATVEPPDSVFEIEEPPMSLMSKIEKFLDSSPRSEQLPEGLKNQSIISLVKVGSIPEGDPTEIPESVLSAPKTEDECVFEEDDSVSGSEVSYRHICTNILSHGELLVNQDKSTGEITWPVVHSPGLRGGSLDKSNESSAAGTENAK